MHNNEPNTVLVILFLAQDICYCNKSTLQHNVLDMTARESTRLHRLCLDNFTSSLCLCVLFIASKAKAALSDRC
jgi:hypothetical protein